MFTFNFPVCKIVNFEMPFNKNKKKIVKVEISQVPPPMKNSFNFIQTKMSSVFLFFSIFHYSCYLSLTYLKFEWLQWIIGPKFIAFSSHFSKKHYHLCQFFPLSILAKSLYWFSYLLFSRGLISGNFFTPSTNQVMRAVAG